MIASLDVEGELFGTDFSNVYVYVGSVARTKVQRCGAQMQSWRDCPVIRISDGAN